MLNNYIIKENKVKKNLAHNLKKKSYNCFCK